MWSGTHKILCHNVKYQGMKNVKVARTPHLSIPTLHGAFLPCLGHFHFMWAFSSCTHFLTSGGTFSPSMGIFILHGAF